MGAAHEAEGDLNQELDESIRATLADINSRAEPEARIPVESTPPPAAAAATDAEPDAPTATDKPRAPDGKFVKGQQIRHQQASTSAAPAKADTPEPVAATATDPVAAEGSEPPLKFGNITVDLARAPSSWKPAAKAVWSALPENVRAEIYRRETDFSNSVLNGPMKQNADFGQAVRQLVEPYRGIIEAEGGTPETAIDELLKTAALFRGGNQQAKLNALFSIDKQFNAGLSDYFISHVQKEIARQTGQPAAQQPAQPQAQQVFQDPRVDELMRSLKTQEQERAERASAEASAAINSFVAAKDENGAPKFIFYDNVRDDMISRIPEIRRANPAMAHSEILQKAYDAAAWANPETRAVLISQQQAPQVAAAQTAQKVTQARRATVGAMPKRGAIPATDPPKSLDDSIRETGQALGLF